jgi:hypothetical protein
MNESDVPSDYETLCQLKCLSYATRTKPLYVFLDSVDQLNPGDNVLGISFLKFFTFFNNI